MAQQFFKKLALTAALVSLGIGMNAMGQSSTGTSSSGGSSASASKSGGKSSSSSLASGERKFIETAAKDGMAEVELGQIAQQKAQNPQVKEFAGRMVQDHGKANDELKTLASNKGVQLPTETDRSHKSKADSLNKKQSDKFDHEYMEEMVKDHKKDVKEFEKQSKNAKDADVRAFASKTLPTLQEHLKMAQAAQDAVKKGGKSGASGGGSAGSATSGGAPSGSTGATGAKTK